MSDVFIGIWRLKSVTTQEEIETIMAVMKYMNGNDTDAPKL